MTSPYIRYIYSCYRSFQKTGEIQYLTRIVDVLRYTPQYHTPQTFELMFRIYIETEYEPAIDVCNMIN